MVNPSLTYEILLYINSFYFGLFATCELGTLILKSVVIIDKYEIQNGLGVIGKDYGALLGLFLTEAIRLFLGRRGSLSERDASVMFSVVLTLPSLGLVLFLLLFQRVILAIERIWCTLMLMLQLLEFGFASFFILTMCRAPSYD